jgi:hypothetical protein
MTAAPFFYVDCDVPPGQTLAAWRHARTSPARCRLVLLLGRLLAHRARPAR